MGEFLEKRGSVLGGAFLIAGTSIGAGMLALPFVTGVSGFWPGLGVNLLAWLYMLCTGLLFLEATLWMPDGANVLSMSRRFLGRIGWLIGGAAFLFLYYSLLVAYFSGIVPLLSEWLGIEPRFMQLLFGGGTFAVILLGAHLTDRVNFLLMVGLIVTYGAMIGIGRGELRVSVKDWGAAWLAVPTLFAAYGYHNIIPSVSTYLRRESGKLQLAILIGTTIPFLVYAAWQWVILSLVPTELLQAGVDGETVTRVLQLATGSRTIVTLVRAFSLFALTTSVLGVALSFVDFLGDGTGLPRKGWGRLALCTLVFFPPLLLSSTMPGLFFTALDYAGAYGEATLNGLLPALMVWVGRYRMGLRSERPLPGGRFTLTLLLLPALFLVLQKTYLIARSIPFGAN